MQFNPKFNLTPALTKQLLEIERHKEAINILPVTGNLIASLRETARLMSTHYSTQIEGNVLNPQEVKQIADGKKGGFPGRERDEREVRNYFRALAYLEEEIKADKKLSETMIKNIHSLVLIGKKSNKPYREGQNVIKDSSTGGIVYMPPEAKDVAPLMKSLITWTNEQIKEDVLPAPVIAGLAHYQFATIHPYYDGNGRTARLLTTYILHKTGYGMKGIYSLEEYYAKNLNGYYQALNIGDSHNYYMGRAEADTTPFLEYFLSGMSISFRSVREKAQQLNVVNSEPDQSDSLRELRPRQKQVLPLFSQSREVGIQEIADQIGAKKQNAYNLVKKWIAEGFLVIINDSRKARTYGLSQKWESLVPTLNEERLKQLEKARVKGKSNDLELGR